MAVDNQTIKELSASGLDNAMPLCIQYPRVAQDKTNEFELKSSLLHHIPKFRGLSMEDPNKHLKEFEVICSSMTPVNVDESISKMKTFPFSLLEKAKDWLYELAPGTVTSWESMKRAFLEKFFPTSRVILLRKRISGILKNQGNTRSESTMLDLGASINVMPYSIYASMNLGELKNDGVIIQLADRSNAYPKGVLGDVLVVQVNHLVFPADFYVLEMEDSDRSPPLPLLLSRPFMKTARTKIDIFKGTLTMEFGGEVIDFNISDAMRYPYDDHSCFSIDVIDSLAQEFLDDLSEDALEKTLT
ncbi:unnamed protein product [Malus baccata var. baccata]